MAGRREAHRSIPLEQVEDSRILAPDRLPPSFLRALDDPPRNPATPAPSATVVLLRQGDEGVEVLLMERSPRSGFIPGAWVFPGGRVDREDADASVLSRVHGLSAREAATLFGTTEAKAPNPLSYWAAGVREAFEEAGVLLAREAGRLNRAMLDEARDRLLSGGIRFGSLLEELDLTIDASSLVYGGHWLTPECEPRRYETRFFLTEMNRDARVNPHQPEMVGFAWLPPEEALRKNREGTLPLVLPTLFTLEQLLPFTAPAAALREMRSRPVPLRLPRPERTEEGIRFRFPR